MKPKPILLILVLTLVLGYLVGQLIPFDFLRPTIITHEISMNDYYTRLISILGAAATILATLVALFKEDIKRLYEFAALKIQYKNNDIISEILEQETHESSNQNLAAKKYELIILVENIGKLAAKSCQIYLEHLTLKNSSYPTPKEFPTTGKPIQWIGKTEPSTIIPSTAKIYVSLIEILSPQAAPITSEDNFAHPAKPQIKIAGIDIAPQYQQGDYNCIFMIYSENARPMEFKLSVTWNGKWEQRLTEMKNCLTFDCTTTRK